MQKSSTTPCAKLTDKCEGACATVNVFKSQCVVKISIHLIVHLINSINCGGKINQEFSDFLHTLLFLDIPTLGESLQEIGFVWNSKKSCLKNK